MAAMVAERTEGLNPKVLKWARVSAHRSVDEVARRMKTQPSTVESWEAGEATPSYPQLEKLAYELYGRPIAIFFFPAPPSDNIRQAFRTLSNDSFLSFPYRLQRIIRKVRAFQIGMLELFDGANPRSQSLTALVAHRGKLLPNVAGAVRHQLGITIETQQTWRNTEKALAQWRSAVEAQGVFVFKEAFHAPAYSGLTMYESEFPIILVNNSMTHSRQIFTLMHELGHVILGSSSIDPARENYSHFLPEYRNEEALCNAFASEVLVPSSAFPIDIDATQILSGDLRVLEAIAERFSVSREVILRRMRDNDLVRPEDYTRIRDQLYGDGPKERRPGGSFYNNLGVYISRAYRTRVMEKLYRGSISRESAADFLGITPTQLMTFETKLLRDP